MKSAHGINMGEGLLAALWVGVAAVTLATAMNVWFLH
jgi:hypothetical protein